MHICRMTVCQHRTQQNWTHVCILHSDFLFLHLIALLLYSQTGALLGAAVQKRKGGKKKKKTLAKVCYLCPVPHGGVLQNRWMEALERLWSSTSGWPRIRQPPPPLPPSPPSLPSSLRSSPPPPPSVTSWKLLDWFLSIWDTAAGPTHQLRPVRHLRVAVHFDYRPVVITYGYR